MLPLSTVTLELDKVLEYLASYAVSEAGSEAIRCLHPLESLEELKQAFIFFEEGCSLVTEKSLRLPSFPSLSPFFESSHLPHTIYDLDTLWVLRSIVQLSSSFYSCFSEPSADKKWFSWQSKYPQHLFPSKSLSALTRCLNDEGNIRDEASPGLSLIRSELRNLHQRCINRVKDFSVEYNIGQYLQDEFLTISSDRYVLPMKVSYKNRLQGVIHDYSQTGETCYFEPLFLVEINNTLRELKREERKEEEKILQYLSDLVREEKENIKRAYDVLVDLDILFAKITLQNKLSGCLLEYNDNEHVLLKNARHPLFILNALEKNQQSTETKKSIKVQDAYAELIPTTIELLAGQKVLLISGRNAGGKTVTLKTLGLIHLMARCALPVPVDSGSSLPFWSSCDAFIGDEQSIEDHVSTFTAQISHLTELWPRLGSTSLLLLDEFGAGTDPTQGAALAQAVIDGLIEKDVWVVTATHFPALKMYALTTDKIRAASVLFDKKTKKPLYKLAYDQVGASHALEVAKEYGLAESVIKRAEELLFSSDDGSNELLDRLNAFALLKEEEIKKLEHEKELIKQRRHKLSTQFTTEKDQYFARVQAEVQSILSELRASQSNERQTVKKLSILRSENLPMFEDELATEKKKHLLSFDSLQVGQEYYHKVWKKKGKIIELDPRKQRACLSLLGVNIWSEIKDLSLSLEVDEKTMKDLANKGEKGREYTHVPIGAVPLRLDIRGFRTEMALSALEQYIDKALLSGREQVEILHGKGTGVLRKEVHAFLKNHRSIRSFADAPEELGGDGVTLVDLL